MIFKMALKSIVGGGLKTWLNVLVITLCYIFIIGYLGMIEGWNEESLRDMKQWEIGGGQYWHQDYDPYDILTLDDSHAPLSPALQGLVAKDQAVAVLIAQGSIFPQGRMLNIKLKGIDPAQQILALPAAQLTQQRPSEQAAIPLLLGTRMARDSGLNQGDTVMLRWRDAQGTFDAADAQVVALMHTPVASMDSAQAWLPMDRLQAMLGLPDEATLITLAPGTPVSQQAGLETGPWKFQDLTQLTSELTAMIAMKSVGGYVIFLILLSMALLAIFDTQVLSIFRRRREIGTMIALGMTRMKVIALFTLEGTMFGVLATLAALLFGTPLLALFAKTGLPMPEVVDGFGMQIAPVIYPIYGVALLVTTVLSVLVAVTIVSFIPARKISKFEPTQLLRGKIS